jgi:hypothetical protein
MADTHFRVTLRLIRLSGIPLCMQTVPRLRTLYNAITASCFFSTYFCMILHLAFSKVGAQEYMKNVRMFFPMSCLMWMHSYIR